MNHFIVLTISVTILMSLNTSNLPVHCITKSMGIINYTKCKKKIDFGTSLHIFSTLLNLTRFYNQLKVTTNSISWYKAEFRAMLEEDSSCNLMVVKVQSTQMFGWLVLPGYT